MVKKFNMSSILNESSLQQIEDAATVKQISLNCIEVNEKNFYAIDGIEKLMQSIKAFGLFDNLVVRNLGDNKYKLISGHRRYAACKALFDSGYTEIKNIPCKIYTCTDDEEYFLLMEGNVHNRIKSDYELMLEMTERKKIFEQYKEQGNSLGGKIRELLAEQLQVSETKIHRLEQIDKKLIPPLKEKLQTGELSFADAVKIAQEPTDMQEEIESTIREKKTEKRQKKTELISEPEVTTKRQENKELRISKMVRHIEKLHNETTIISPENREKIKLLEEQAYNTLSEISKIYEDNN